MLYFHIPLDHRYKRVSSHFGWRWIQVGDMKFPVKNFHRGQDHPCPVGTEIKPCYKGYVSRIWESFRAGLCAEITHDTCGTEDFPVKSVYYHLSKILVPAYKVVREDEVIFLSGNSGKWTSGAHLHWGVVVNGRYIDPRITYLRHTRIHQN